MAIKSDDIEFNNRVRQVMEWILAGHSTTDIIKSCITKWEVGERQAYKYHKKAFEQFKEALKLDTQEQLSFHIAARLKLFNGVTEKTKAYQAGVSLEILKDIAKLQGLYVDKSESKTVVVNQVSDDQFEQLLTAAREAKTDTGE